MAGKYGWGVDGFGRQHVCIQGNIIVCCVLPGESVLTVIDDIEKEKKRGNEMDKGKSERLEKLLGIDIKYVDSGHDPKSVVYGKYKGTGGG